MPHHPTVPPTGDEQLIDEFIVQADVAETTRVHYRSRLAEFRCWLHHPRTTRASTGGLLEVSRADVARFMSYLTAEDRYAAGSHHRLRRKLSASSRKAFISAIHSFYEYLITVELVDANPTAAVPRPKVRVRRGMCLTADELRRLLDAPGNPRDRIQVFLLAFTGARVGEIRNLRWRDINFEHGTILLHGKGDKDRLIFIHPRLMPELRRWALCLDHRAEQDLEYRAIRANPETDFVLVTRTGRRIPDTAIHKQLKRRAVLAGLYPLEPAHREHRSLVTPHVLRRTFATILLNEGEHIDAVADVLGHESVDTTRKHYAFASEQRRRATINAFKV